jgi:endonuclease YncB( thermonuclease family)
MSVHGITRERLSVLTASLWLALTPAPARAQAPPPGSGPIDFGGFVRVIDGDTFEVYIDGHQSGIGIVGIRSAQGNTACGKEATAFLETLIGRGRIRLEEDPVADPYDARKRRMYRLVLPDGRSAAIAIARAGFARATGEGIEKNEIAAAAAAAAAGGGSCVSPAR